MESVFWSGAVAVTSISFACAFYYTAAAWFEHRERMAKLEHGIDPDKSRERMAKLEMGIDPDQANGDAKA